MNEKRSEWVSEWVVVNAVYERTTEATNASQYNKRPLRNMNTLFRNKQ
jgi:hypothetical protein